MSTPSENQSTHDILPYSFPLEIKTTICFKNATESKSTQQSLISSPSLDAHSQSSKEWTISTITIRIPSPGEESDGDKTMQLANDRTAIEIHPPTFVMNQSNGHTSILQPANNTATIQDTQNSIKKAHSLTMSLVENTGW